MSSRIQSIAELSPIHLWLKRPVFVGRMPPVKAPRRMCQGLQHSAKTARGLTLGQKCWATLLRSIPAGIRSSVYHQVTPPSKAHPGAWWQGNSALCCHGKRSHCCPFPVAWGSSAEPLSRPTM
eukprot:4867152-Amphidinium_carterae.2